MHRITRQLVFAAAVWTLLGTSVDAADRRAPFEALYSLSEIHETEADASLVLTISLVNRSGAEVHSATLVLPRGEQPETAQPYAAFQQVSMPVAGSVRLREVVLLTAQEFAEWSSGRPLFAEAEWRDENGVARSARIDLRQVGELPESE